MKGGVTCLGGMFSRRNKVKHSAIIGDAIIVKDSSRVDLTSEGAFNEYSMRFLPDEGATMSTANHNVHSEWAGGQVHVDGLFNPVVESTPPTNVNIVVVTDGGLSRGSMARPHSVNGFVDVEYEGEDDQAQDVRGSDSDRHSSEGRDDPAPNGVYSSQIQVLDKETARYYNPISENEGGLSASRVANCFRNPELASGHISDPGVYYAKGLESACSSPWLNDRKSEEKENNEMSAQSDRPRRARSDLEHSARTQDSLSVVSGHHTTAPSYESGSSTTGELRDGACVVFGGSPKSEAAYRFGGDFAMFKYDAAGEAMEAPKRKAWWKVFLVSHRNIHREARTGALGPVTEGETGRSLSPVNGYVSDVDDRSGRSSPSLGVAASNCDGQGSGKGNNPLPERSSDEEDVLLQQSAGIRTCNESANDGGGGAVPKVIGEVLVGQLAPSATAQNWLSFAEKAGLSRVEEWVSNIHPHTLDEDELEIQTGNGPESPTAPAASFFNQLGEESPFKDLEDKHGVGALGRAEETLDADAEMAKMVVRSVNPLSTVAHFSGVGLKVLPSLGVYNSLKTLNLSANSFVRITPGCLPKSLHKLDLSRNHIVIIEGLRELTRLRALNLSFNRITRIGNGLSSCMSLKELYLAGNKISEVEGLHRLSKLSVLDLSFNKLTSTKSLGQIAANYKSLQALNLLGNAVQSNLGDDHMRRFVTGICPQVLYLNKQPLKSVSNRDAVDKTVARAAFGKSSGAAKTATKQAKRAAATHSTGTHRRTHSGGGTSKIKSGNKGAVSPLVPTQDPGHHRKPHYIRPQEKAPSVMELPKGFVPLPESAYPPFIDRKGVLVERDERTLMPRVRSDGMLFRAERSSFLAPVGAH